MFQRLIRVVGSFTIVVMAYWVYAHTVVPFIEPPIGPVKDKEKEDDGGDPPLEKEAIDPNRQRLLRWFKPGDWELNSSQVLDTPSGIILINKYEIIGDRTRVRLRPCTMVFLPEDKQTTDPEERDRRAIVMRSSPDRGEAILTFDKPFDISQGKIGKVVGGQVIGNVTIYSQQRSLGPEDDLLVHVSNVELRRDRISSSQPVHFRWGNNVGQGQKLKIDLSPKGRDEGYHGLLSLELSYNVMLHLEGTEGDLFPGGVKPPASASPPQARPPVEVHCVGPFRFDFVENLATFQSDVKVLRLNPTGAVDQLNCELMTLYFKGEKAQLDPSAPRPANNPPPLKLQPARFAAFGQPVVINAPSNQIKVQAGQVEYDIENNSGTLRDNKEVILEQEGREIHARELSFQPDDTRQLGRFLAKGSGWVKGLAPGSAQQTFEARWSRQLHFRPHERQHVLSLEGDAHVKVDGQGSLDAEEIHAWMWETRVSGPDPGAAQKVQLVPDRLLAIGQVRIDTPQLTSAVSQLQMWFEQASALGAARVPNHILPQITPLPPTDSWRTSEPAPPRMTPPSMAPLASSSALEATVPAPPSLPADPTRMLPPAAPSFAVQNPVATAAPANRLHVEGELLRVLARNSGKQMELSEVFVEHDVKVTEGARGEPNEQPLTITGQRLHLVQKHAHDAVVGISGQPARVEGRGLSLRSSAVYLNRFTSAIWTDAEGELTLMLDRDPNGKLLPQPQPLDVTWAGRLQFNGRTARFERSVVARQNQQRVETNVLEVTLSSALNLSGGQPPGTRPEVEQITCREGAYLEAPTFDGNQLVSVDRMKVIELSVQRISGDLKALGPGWVKSVRVDTGQTDGKVLGINPAVATPQPPTNIGSRLAFVGVEFQGGIVGNAHRREMAFENGVRTIYGPVSDWRDELSIDQPRPGNPRQLLLTSDRLSLAQVPGRTPNERLVEMEATGNAIVEGANYTARAARLTYSQLKELLVLEGNGRSEAQLTYRQTPQAADSKLDAGKIMFWPATNSVQFNNSKNFEFAPSNNK